MHLFNSSKEDRQLSEIYLDLFYVYQTGFIRKLGIILFIHVSSFNFAIRGMKPFYHLYSLTVASEDDKIYLFHSYLVQFRKCCNPLSSA